jgi:hypothetical protein
VGIYGPRFEGLLFGFEQIEIAGRAAPVDSID